MPKQTLTIDLQAGRLGEFLREYDALFPSSSHELDTPTWLREHDRLQGNIANELCRQWRETPGVDRGTE